MPKSIFLLKWLTLIKKSLNSPSPDTSMQGSIDKWGKYCKRVSGVLHEGRVAAFGPGDPGSNPGKGRYIFEFKLII